MIGEDRIMRILDCRMRNVCLKVRDMGHKAQNNQQENTGARIQNTEVRRQTADDREQKKALRIKM